ncbi:MAG: methylated-DNA--[protein]-cysteine S-methyltransferase [Jatrophihabitans sp.]
MYYSTHISPVGELLATAAVVHGPITGLYLPAQNRHPAVDWVRHEATFAVLWAQLTEYFAGSRKCFDLKLAPAGTPLQEEVWRQLQQIEYGDTVTYSELAASVARPGSPRAIGSANARNPISIVIPCHRVIGRNGSLTGYAGGLPAKQWLLTHEGALDGASTRPDDTMIG